MRIRTIKPEFWEDEGLATLPPHARLLFIATWQLADRNGVLENRPAWIKAKVFPYETGEAVDASRLLPQLITAGYLVEFASGGKNYLHIPTFSKHQRLSGKELGSDGLHPLPPTTCKTGSDGEAPGKHPGSTIPVTLQGTGNGVQGTGNGEGSVPRAGEAESVEAVIPTPEEVVAEGDRMCVPPDFCRHYHGYQEINNRWLVGPVGREKVRGWKAELKVWWERDRATWGKQPPTANGRPMSVSATAMALTTKMAAATEERKQLLDKHTYPNPDGGKGWGSSATPEIKSRVAELGAMIKDCNRRLSDLSV
jgi:hypothetical protein